MSRVARFKPRILGVGYTPLGRLNKTASCLSKEALTLALNESKLQLSDIQGLIACPSLSHPHFMEAHYLATRIGLLPNPSLLLRTVDTGGAGPVTALLEAKRMIEQENATHVAIVASDAVLSMESKLFLERADSGCQRPSDFPQLKSPVIPNGYDLCAKYQMNKYNITREQLAMCSVLMSKQAINHPYALTKNEYSLLDVLNSRKIGEVTNLLECARRSDGGAAIIVSKGSYLYNLKDENKLPSRNIVIRGGGEGSGPLYPRELNDLCEDDFSCEMAMNFAFEECNVSKNDIDFFGLYDCFPICLIRAIEGVGLCNKGQGGQFIEYFYNKFKNKQINVNEFPINTHGGLTSFGAPWEVPAMYNIIEAVEQLSNTAINRQISNCNQAIVYGNGGVFSHSAVAILSKPVVNWE